MQFARATGVWWRAGDSFELRLAGLLGSSSGYGRWADAVAAAAALSAGPATGIAICDDRGRLYLHRVLVSCWFGDRPFHMGERRELGYEFRGVAVRGIVDGDVTASRGDCLHRWIARPAGSPRQS